MSYDNPYRVSYQFSGDPQSALSRNIPVPKDAMRFRVTMVAHEQTGFGSGESATLTQELGTASDADAFHTSSLTVDGDNAPTATDSERNDSHEVEDDLDEIVFTRSADASAPASQSVTTYVVIDWF